MTAPVIGVTTSSRSIDTELGDARPHHLLGTEYLEPLQSAGAAPLLLVPGTDAATVLGRLDALVLVGGIDVDPVRYGADREPGKTYDVARDSFELALVRAARERGIPVLAICRGMQLTNVAFGGTLIVDLPATNDHHPVRDSAAQLDERHRVVIDAGSDLAAIYGTTERTVNTIHHQALDIVADGFVVTARAADGVVEAVECPGDWWYQGVQWHPEKFPEPEADDERVLFAAFLDAARAHALIRS